MLDLDKLEEKAKFSGWPRDDGVKVILKLIRELRTVRATVETLGDEVLRLEKAPTNKH